MSKLLCIYHANCDDGFGAAYAVWKRLGEGAEFFAASYGNPPPDAAGRDVAIVDFSYKRQVMREIAAKAASVLVLDHHKTAEAELAGLDAECPNAAVYFDMSRSGAMMAWDHFHERAPAPELFRYLQDRDLWTKQLPGVDEFTAALRSYPQDFAVWDTLSVPKLIMEGEAIQRYYRTLVEGMKPHAYFHEIAGYRVPVVNASLFMASELAGELAEGHPFAATYAENETHVTWSLRSRAPDGLDVSEIAKIFGGGGHKHAAGFRSERTRLGALGEFPQGKLTDDDEGALKMAVGYDPVDGIVRVEFGKPVAWLGLSPPEARQLAGLLLHHAGK